MVKKEQAGRKLLKVDLISNHCQMRVSKKCFTSRPYKPALGAFLEGWAIVAGLAMSVHDDLRSGFPRPKFRRSDLHIELLGNVL